ncbi:uncharacterized protein Tco025E_06585 [Trypanosoma conorhini]|uniref:Uncharacterized protein n=1 Tax=Trypanosoma conorhini TaxID=83891 RepID=A0A3R7N288_9TRYP|nr:uncharacterized protein Tco025E_06585 [Trypanosoma conorhini]RNF11651.1 hypothetical protein Tco025E_06585 [Trypanosoma conorhini]
MHRACAWFCHLSSSSRSFVGETLQRRPGASLLDILAAWCSQESLNAGSSDAHAAREAARGPTGGFDTAEVQLLNKLREDAIKFGWHRHLQLCSVAHFAAELGSTYLLELLSSQGVTLHADHRDDAQTSQEGSHARCVTLEAVVLSCPDVNGRYLSHLAAQNGHLDFLQRLVECFGPEAVLGQRTAEGGPRRSGAATSLDVYGAAFVYGQDPILAWMERAHPTHTFGAAEEDALYCVQRAGAFGQLGSLAHFLRRHGAACHTTLREAFYPAAEAGAGEVLEFLVETLGSDALWCPSDTGATVLHHAARLGRVELLDGVLQRHCVEQHVDDADNCGRTPAMWCVMGGKRRSNVEFLRRLLELGSQWPTATDHGGRSVGSFARLHHAPSSKLRRFVTRCIAATRGPG